MHTPAHVVLNSVLLGRGRWQACWLPITAGAVLPDLPMVWFYIYQRYLQEVSPRVIWSEKYFEPQWQALIDLFNSFPLILLGAVVAWRWRSTPWCALFASMALHCVADLLVHHDDGHAHFFPFSSWHFESPISYWDRRHYGSQFRLFERGLVVLGSIWMVLGGVRTFATQLRTTDALDGDTAQRRTRRATMTATGVWCVIGLLILSLQIAAWRGRRRPRPSSENW